MADSASSIQIALRFLDQASAPMQTALDKITRSTMSAERALAGVTGLMKKGLVAVAAEMSVSKLMGIGKEYETAMVRVKNVFQGEAEAVVESLELISNRSKKLFDFSELAMGAAKINDTFDVLDLSSQDLAVTLTRVTDVSKAKGLDLEESITKVNSAIMGAAKSGRQLGVVLTDSYMEFDAFNGKLKGIWSTLSEGDKAFWRFNEFLRQSEKYAGAAAKESTTLGGSLSALGNTIKDRLEPALAAACSGLAKYINLARQAISPESLSSQILAKTQQLSSVRRIGGEVLPEGNLGIGGAIQSVLAPGLESDILSMRARLRGERAGRESLAAVPMTTGGLPQGWEEHVAGIKGVEKATKAAGDSMKDFNRIMEEGYRIEQSTWNATEKYNAELDRLSYYLGYGAISQDTYAKAVQSTWDELVRAAEATDSWRGHLEVLKQGEAVFAAIRTEAEKYAEEIDRLSYLLGYGAITQDTYTRAIEAAGVKFSSTTDKMSEFAIQAARNIQDALGDQLYNMLTGRFDDVGQSFLQLLARMASQAAASQIGNMLFGDFGSSSKQLGGLAGDFLGLFGFGGAKAGGGSVSPGKGYLVGERGPELFMPRSSGTIVPNQSLSSLSPKFVVQLKNESGHNIEAEQGRASFDGEGYIVSVVLKSLKTSPQYRDAMRGFLR